MSVKTVSVVGHSFDCLAAHIQIGVRASGHNVRVATERAVAEVLSDKRLRHKQINEFKLTVVVIADRKIGGGE